MSDEYRIVEVCREPLPAGHGGVRVRARLTARPSRRWSRGVSARLAGELVGRTAVGHLQADRVVQDDQLVLESGEASQAPVLADALIWAVGATNQAGSAHHILTARVAPDGLDPLAPAPPPALGGPWSAPDPGDRVEPSRWFG